MAEMLSYKNKRVVITGCFSGMGNATAKMLLELGAEVHGLDYQKSTLDLASFTEMDLRDPASIDAAIKKLPDKIDRVFNCAGLPSTFSQMDTYKVNYIGPRRVTEHLIPRINTDGGAIAWIASTAAFNWPQYAEKAKELIALTKYEEAVSWAEKLVEAGNNEAYTITKTAIIVWTMMGGAELIKRGIRMNCILPGPTQTPFMEKETTKTPDKFVDIFTMPINRRASAEEQAAPLVFLNSDAARYISGVALPVDGGFMGAVTTGVLDLAKEFGAVQGAAA